MILLRYLLVLAMVNILALEPWQLLQYSYVCSSMMSVHPESGDSARDTRVSLTSVDVVSRLVKCCWMSPFLMVCRGSRQVVTTLSVPSNPSCSDWGGRRSIKSRMVWLGSSRQASSGLPVVPI